MVVLRCLCRRRGLHRCACHWLHDARVVRAYRRSAVGGDGSADIDRRASHARDDGGHPWPCARRTQDRELDCVSVHDSDDWYDKRRAFRRIDRDASAWIRQPRLAVARVRVGTAGLGCVPWPLARLRRIYVAYGGLLPVIALSLSKLFRRDAAEAHAKGRP